MRYLIDLFAWLLIGGTDTGTGAAILWNIVMAVLVAPDDLLTEHAFAGVFQLVSAISDTVRVGSLIDRPLVDDGSTAGVQNFLSDVLESAVDREAACTDIARGLGLVSVHPGVFAAKGSTEVGGESRRLRVLVHGRLGLESGYVCVHITEASEAILLRLLTCNA